MPVNYSDFKKQGVILEGLFMPFNAIKSIFFLSKNLLKIFEGKDKKSFFLKFRHLRFSSKKSKKKVGFFPFKMIPGSRWDDFQFSRYGPFQDRAHHPRCSVGAITSAADEYSIKSIENRVILGNLVTFVRERHSNSSSCLSRKVFFFNTQTQNSYLCNKCEKLRIGHECAVNARAEGESIYTY